MSQKVTRVNQIAVPTIINAGVTIAPTSVHFSSSNLLCGGIDPDSGALAVNQDPSAVGAVTTVTCDYTYASNDGTTTKSDSVSTQLKVAFIPDDVSGSFLTLNDAP